MKLIYLFILLFLSVGPITAQRILEGEITDGNGSPLVGVSIIARGGENGPVIEISDIRGRYRLSISPGVSNIVFNYVNCEPKIRTVPPPNVDHLDIVMDCLYVLQEVLVNIGSPGARQRMESAVPVDLIDIGKMNAVSGYSDLNQALNLVLPTFNSARQTIADGTDHIDPASLRGLGPDQVLVLVDGKRYHKTALVNVNGTVNRGTVGTDLSSIPMSAIDKIEVLRDGAAAQYGSDAIAGVINIRLKKRQTGFSFLTNYGQSVSSYPKNYYFNATNNRFYNLSDNVNASDGQVFRAALNYGRIIADSGFIGLTAEGNWRGATNRTGSYTGQIYPSQGSQVVDDVILKARELTRKDFDMQIGNSAINSYGFLLNGEYPLGPGLTLYTFGSINYKFGEAAGFFRFPSGYPGVIADTLISIYPNGFLPVINSTVTDQSFCIGMKKSFGGLETDLSYNYGKNKFSFQVDQSVNYSQVFSDPTIQTSFECGNLAFSQHVANLNLKKQLNVWESLTLLGGAEFRIENFVIDSGETASWKNYNTALNVTSGAQVFAGFLPSNSGSFSRNNLAFYLDSELKGLDSRLQLGGAYRFERYSDFGSTRNLKGTLRYVLLRTEEKERDELTERANKEKQRDKLAIRASANTGFRAPSLQQINYSKTSTLFVSTSGGIVPIEAGTFKNGSAIADTLGIPKLKEETSNNYSFGLVSQPISNLQLSLDGYYIKIKDRIILTNNFDGSKNPALLDLIEPFGANAANFFTNAVDTRSIGLEFVASYKILIGKEQFLSFDFSGSTFQNKVIDSAEVFNNGVKRPFVKASDKLIQLGEVNNYFNREDESRLEVAIPTNKLALSASYRNGTFNATVRVSRFGKVVYNDPTISPSDTLTFKKNLFTGKNETLDQTFSPKTITDLSMGIKFDRYTLTLGANNIFNIYPDIHHHSENYSSGRFLYSRRVNQMGFNGRFIYATLLIDFAR